MTQMIQDIRYAARLYRKSPGFTATTVLLLALGISANTILFSVIDAVFLRPLPVSHPEELVRFVQTIPGSTGSDQYDYPFYLMLRERSELFVGVLAQLEMNLALRDGMIPERSRADCVSGNFFSLFRGTGAAWPCVDSG